MHKRDAFDIIMRVESRRSCLYVDFLGAKAIFASPLLCVALGCGIIPTAKSLNNVRIIADEEHSNTA